MRLVALVRYALRHAMRARDDESGVTDIQGLNGVGKPGQEQTPITHRVGNAPQVALAQACRVDAESGKRSSVGKKHQDRRPRKQPGELSQDDFGTADGADIVVYDNRIISRPHIVRVRHAHGWALPTCAGTVRNTPSARIRSWAAAASLRKSGAARAHSTYRPTTLGSGSSTDHPSVRSAATDERL